MYESRKGQAAVKIKNRIFNKILSCVFVSVLMISLCSCSMDFTPKPTGAIANPKLTVVEFVDSIKAGDYKKCESLVSNYAELGFSDGKSFRDDAVSQFFYDCLINSYKVEFIDNDNIVSVTDSVSDTDYSVHGRSAQVKFLFTYFDSGKMTARMKEIATEIGHEKMYYGFVYDSEEKVDELVLDVLDVVQTEPVEQYYVTREITVNMVYADDEWKMELTDEFYDILLGGHAE